MRKLSRFGIGIGLVAAATFASAGTAAAFVPQAPTFVDCTRITIDPPPFAAITFIGTIGGVNVNLPAAHIPNSVFSTADDTAYTGATGPIHYAIAPYWHVGPNPFGVTSGFGPPAVGTLTCHRVPTTTTSTTVPSTSTTAAMVPPKKDDLAPPTSITRRPPELPYTGSSPITLPLAAFGAACVLGGAGLLLKGRRGRY